MTEDHDTPTPENTPAPPTRRGLLKLFGAAAAGGVVAMAVGDRADAANGDPLLLGTVSNSATGGTGLEVDGTKVAYGLGVTDNGLGSTPDEAKFGAVFGHAKGQAFNFGVVGYTELNDQKSSGVLGYSAGFGRGVTGHSSGFASVGVEGLADGDLSAGVLGTATKADGIGIAASSAGVGIAMTGGTGAVGFVPWDGAGTAAPPARSSVNFPMQCLDVDRQGDLWWSVTTGKNAQWRKVAGPGTGGAFHPLAPTRVFDSRVAAPHKGQIAGGHPLTVSVKDGRSATTGAATHANLVPAKATAIACNVTVTNTVGAGHLTLNPGGVTGATAITVAWNASGQTHTTGTIAKINSSTLQVTLAVVGMTKADVIIDITGYWR